MCDSGAQFGQILHFLLRQVDLAEQRVGEDFVQLGEEAVLVGGSEVTQVEVIVLRQPEQDLRRHRPLVPLYQIDIARRNPKALGHLGLRQAHLLAQPAEPWPHKKLLPGIARHRPASRLSVTKLTILHLLHVFKLHDITIRSQEGYTIGL